MAFGRNTAPKDATAPAPKQGTSAPPAKADEFTPNPGAVPPPDGKGAFRVDEANGRVSRGSTPTAELAVDNTGGGTQHSAHLTTHPTPHQPRHGGGGPRGPSNISPPDKLAELAAAAANEVEPPRFGDIPSPSDALLEGGEALERLLYGSEVVGKRLRGLRDLWKGSVARMEAGGASEGLRDEEAEDRKNFEGALASAVNNLQQASRPLDDHVRLVLFSENGTPRLATITLKGEGRGKINGHPNGLGEPLMAVLAALQQRHPLALLGLGELPHGLYGYVCTLMGLAKTVELARRVAPILGWTEVTLPNGQTIFYLAKDGHRIIAVTPSLEDGSAAVAAFQAARTAAVAAEGALRAAAGDLNEAYEAKSSSAIELATAQKRHASAQEGTAAAEAGVADKKAALQAARAAAGLPELTEDEAKKLVAPAAAAATDTDAPAA